MTTLESKLKQAQGLGSSKSGVHHWWAQRVTAALLAPLMLWFAIVVIVFWAAPYEHLILKFHSIWAVSALSALIILMLYHGFLGMQVIIEDYVHHEKLKIFLIIFFQFLSFFGGLMALISMISIMTK
ncbi:Succinate dehydrogenase, hydrophobic membrane anchor protein [Candidatus Bealeia paramacronuclearis]|uniref:Succinate dehydrogenase hydrophobic membrane anchor subunit n=1 Tax=Candidatus Bealeia paramacronuclearis TaxID=1921001 RepID=A0ABZ2C6J5_9PROT|nr:Succinate dehydrogenase, hydrophobic membrane anchor protein [Candidatus Bealeia paramacronuclearis]